MNCGIGDNRLKMELRWTDGHAVGVLSFAKSMDYGDRNLGTVTPKVLPRLAEPDTWKYVMYLVSTKPFLIPTTNKKLHVAYFMHEWRCLYQYYQACGFGLRSTTTNSTPVACRFPAKLKYPVHAHGRGALHALGTRFSQEKISGAARDAGDEGMLRYEISIDCHAPTQASLHLLSPHTFVPTCQL